MLERVDNSGGGGGDDHTFHRGCISLNRLQNTSGTFDGGIENILDWVLGGKMAWGGGVNDEVELVFRLKHLRFEINIILEEIPALDMFWLDSRIPCQIHPQCQRLR